MCHSPLGSNLYPPDLVGGNVAVFWIIPDPLFAAAKFSRPIELSVQADKPRRKSNDLKEAARIMGTERSIRGGRKYADAKTKQPCGGGGECRVSLWQS